MAVDGGGLLCGEHIVAYHALEIVELPAMVESNRARRDVSDIRVSSRHTGWGHGRRRVGRRTKQLAQAVASELMLAGVDVLAGKPSVETVKNVDLVWARLRHVRGAISSVGASYLLPVYSPDITSDQIDVYRSAGLESLRDSIPDQLFTETRDIQSAMRNEPLRTELSHFLSCVREDRPSAVCTPEDAIHVVEVVNALMDSASTNGEAVAV